MRNAAILVVCWACNALAATADDTWKLVDLGTYFSSANGQLSISLIGDQFVWENGRRLAYFPNPECGMMDTVFLNTGDTLLLGGADGFTLYQLSRLSSKEATFTIWKYAAEATDHRCYRVGPLKSKVSATLSLPLEITDDSEPNLVQLGHGPAARTK